MVGSFLDRILGDRVLRLPGALEQAYCGAIRRLEQDFPNLGELTYSLDEDTPQSVASQFHRLFPSHCLKFMRALAQLEREEFTRGGTTNLLGWPTVTLVDVGCGAGAASAALLALLQAYQEFVEANGGLLSRIEVFLVGLDPSEESLRLYKEIVGDYGQSLSERLVDLTVEVVRDSFPQGIQQVTRRFRPPNRASALLAMSNVIRPFGLAFRVGTTSWFERVRRSLTGRAPGEPRFGDAEAAGIGAVLADWELDRLGVLSIATSGMDPVTGTRWCTMLDQLGRGIVNSMAPHAVRRKGVTQVSARFENPQGSWWRRCRGHLEYTKAYYFDFLAVTSQSYAADRQWQSVLAAPNMELAWARARRYALHEVLADEIEILLFDDVVTEKLDRLRKRIQGQDWAALNVEQTLRFDAPKKPGETRPKTVTRLEEQTLSAAMVQQIGRRARHYQRASYSHVLNDRRDEFLYKYWLWLWKKFLDKSQQLAKGRRVLRSDVSTFYQKVDQFKLVEVALRVLAIGHRTEQLLRRLLLRDCGPRHAPGEGLPQGHVASGFWANIYLGQCDALLSKLPGLRFARYADDMVCAIDEAVSEPGQVERELRQALDAIGLQPSEDKTRPESGAEYITETALDNVLDALDRTRFKPLVSKVYSIGGTYRNAYELDPWGFVSTYRRLLALIPIYVSGPWLRRKLDRDRSWRPWSPLGKLRFPRLPGSPDVDDLWLDEFLGSNASWKRKLDQVRCDLAELCRASIAVLSTPDQTDLERQTAARRLRFASYRLCVLGLDEVADALGTQVMERPCRVPVHLVCRGLAHSGRADLLGAIGDGSECAFVRACAARAVADLRPSPGTPDIDRLWAVVSDPSSAGCEKLKASEALLAVDDYWERANLEECERLIEQETDPYLLKNYVLIAGRAFGECAQECLLRLRRRRPHPIVMDAIGCALRGLVLSPIQEREPHLLKSYYAADYPVVEWDTKEDQSP